MAVELPDAVIAISTDGDVTRARQRGRELGAAVGVTGSDLTLLATAISEIARNVVLYARGGEMVFEAVESGGRRGLRITTRDQGPGIPDLTLAMQDGWSTSRGMGLGLPGARRLMDEFHIESRVGEGTTVTMIKWGR